MPGIQQGPGNPLLLPRAQQVFAAVGKPLERRGRHRAALAAGPQLERQALPLHPRHEQPETVGHRAAQSLSHFRLGAREKDAHGALKGGRLQPANQGQIPVPPEAAAHQVGQIVIVPRRGDQLRGQTVAEFGQEATVTGNAHLTKQVGTVGFVEDRPDRPAHIGSQVGVGREHIHQHRKTLGGRAVNIDRIDIDVVPERAARQPGGQVTPGIEAVGQGGGGDQRMKARSEFGEVALALALGRQCGMNTRKNCIRGEGRSQGRIILHRRIVTRASTICSGKNFLVSSRDQPAPCAKRHQPEQLKRVPAFAEIA